MFKTRTFARWSRKAGLGDAALRAAVDEMAAGLVDADLGGRVYKKRVPLPAGASAVARVRWLVPTWVTAGSSCSASRRMIATALTPVSWLPCSPLRARCSN